MVETGTWTYFSFDVARQINFGDPDLQRPIVRRLLAIGLISVALATYLAYRLYGQLVAIIPIILGASMAAVCSAIYWRVIDNPQKYISIRPIVYGLHVTEDGVFYVIERKNELWHMSNKEELYDITPLGKSALRQMAHYKLDFGYYALVYTMQGGDVKVDPKM